MVVGGQELTGDEKEVAATLGPHRKGVSGREGAKLETGMGAGPENISPYAIYRAGVSGERAGGRMGTVGGGGCDFNSLKADVFGRGGDGTTVSVEPKGEMDNSASVSKAEEDRWSPARGGP
jgi:hypothetical protein